MIWLSPWALLGLLGVALPALIHLLGRGHAPRRRFPSLRFLDPSRLLPTQRTRIHDPWLLAVRAAIVALAAIALARPLWLSTNRKRALDRGIARVAIVDTGWSTRRTVAAARDSARAFVRSVQAGIVVESAQPRGALAGAVNWLARERRRSEIAIYSAFPSGSLDSADLAGVPQGIGLTMVPLAMGGMDSVVRLSANGRGVAASAGYDRGTTTVQWTADGSASRAAIRLLASRSDSTIVAALDAVMRSVPLPVAAADSARVVAVVFAGAPELAQLRASASPVNPAWLFERLARMPQDLRTIPRA